MSSRDPELDRLTNLLGECLGRIDEEAYRLLQDGESFDSADQLEDQAARLQELVDELLVVRTDDATIDVNRVVERTATACVEDLSVPVVLRSNLTQASTELTAPVGLVEMAIQRALVLATTDLAAGGELSLTTRVEGGCVLLEIESYGNDMADDETGIRAETLREFVDGIGGSCAMRAGEGNELFLVLELPRVLTTERSETDGFA